MAVVDQKLMLERAKARAVQDSFAWDLNSVRRGTRPLSEARRPLYLEQAEDEPNKNAGKPAPPPSSRGPGFATQLSRSGARTRAEAAPALTGDGNGVR